MAEKIALTTPHVVDPRQATNFEVHSVQFNYKDKIITIHVGENGIQKMITYTDLPATFDAQGNPVAANPIATTLMLALNKANLSTKSLHRRILERLVADGHIAGTISGTPD